MSDTVIKDGTGTGSRAGVDANNRLRTVAVVESEIEFASAKYQLGFTFPCLDRTVLTASGESHLMWVRNNDPKRLFHVNRIVVGYNGGSTNHNRCAIARLRIGTPAPTVNHVAFAPGNLFLGSPVTALVEAYQWNTVGTGMTVASSGPTAFSAPMKQGITDIPFEGALIIPYNAIIDFTVSTEEDGLVSIVMSGWYNQDGT